MRRCSDTPGVCRVGLPADLRSVATSGVPAAEELLEGIASNVAGHRQRLRDGRHRTKDRPHGERPRSAGLPFVGVTFAEHGSELYLEGQHVRIPAVPAEPLIEPTGGGDAYGRGCSRALLGLPLEIAGRMGSVAATYAVDGMAARSTHIPRGIRRFVLMTAFPEYAGAVRVGLAQCPVERRSGDRAALVAVHAEEIRLMVESPTNTRAFDIKDPGLAAGRAAQN